MKPIATWMAGAVALLASITVAGTARAATVPVFYDQLTDAKTAGAPLNGDDTLFMDTLVTTEIGSLTQTTTFTVGPNVQSLTGAAAWEVTAADGAGPRLVGVNIDIFDSNDALVLSDTFAGVLASFAHSTFAGPIGPGTYTVVATGNAIRAASLDISLTFSEIPEPGTAVLLLSGLGLLGLRARRARASRRVV